MPPEGFTSITVPDRVVEDLLAVMATYECASVAEAVAVAATVALERDEAKLARILADRLNG